MSAIILFDGVCNLCNGAVQFVIRRDPQGYFKFAALESESGRELRRRFGLAGEAIETMVVVEDERAYVESEAALRIARKLGGAWPLFGALRVIPRTWRDRAYRFLASHRYQWFGKRDACPVPTPDLRARFLA